MKLTPLQFKALGVGPSRRECIRLGVATLLAGGMVRAKPVKRPAKAKQVLVLFTAGGMSQFETWDPKPNAPEEIRGEFGSIATAVPGLRFGEHLPKLAKLADKLTVLKSMTHDDIDHGSACYLALTGQFHPRKSSNPGPSPNDFPTLGAILQRVRPHPELPASAVHVNGPVQLPLLPGPGNGAGLLGRAYDPFTLNDPGDAATVLQNLGLSIGVSPRRHENRRGLLEQLDRREELGDSHPQSVQAAYDFLSTKTIRNAFDLSQEPASLHEAYGKYRSGQTCLLARRLVEAGVPWVTAFFNHSMRGQDREPNNTEVYGWDTHNDIFLSLKEHLLPRFDHSFAALLQDMDDRGLLKDTLVACIGEFGRAPQVAVEKSFKGTLPGRRHWGACYSVVLAGAGIQRGAVYGASDKQGAYPQSHPVTPGDLVATLFDALGIDPASHYTDATNRPYTIASGQPVTGLFG